jgi:hypothetical protein
MMSSGMWQLNVNDSAGRSAPGSAGNHSGPMRIDPSRSACQGQVKVSLVKVSLDF